MISEFSRQIEQYIFTCDNSNKNAIVIYYRNKVLVRDLLNARDGAELVHPVALAAAHLLK